MTTYTKQQQRELDQSPVARPVRWVQSIVDAATDAKEDSPEMVVCTRCNQSGEIAISSATGLYRCAGPVPDNALGVLGITCDECHGIGMVEDQS